MEYKKITIIGVGLIGGSFALSLRKSGFTGRIEGIGRNEQNLVNAQKLGVVDGYSISPSDGVRDADLVFLATPVGQFPSLVQDFRGSLKPGTLVTDAGSVKAEVLKRLEPMMPDGVHFVGGHPIAGKECSGVEAASSELFTGATCIITPGRQTNKDALEKTVLLWKAIGAKTVFMDPDKHDSIFASVSHVPHVVSYALINSITDTGNDILLHGGRGLRDMTRIALSPPELWRDICEYNRENILRTLKQFVSEVSHLEQLVKSADWNGLRNEFQRAKAGRQILETD